MSLRKFITIQDLTEQILQYLSEKCIAIKDLSEKCVTLNDMSESVLQYKIWTKMYYKSTPDRACITNQNLTEQT